MKSYEIEQFFTAKMIQYIAAGYTINPGTMAGHQGEIVPRGWARREKSGKKAKRNIASILPAYGFMPFFSTKTFGR